MADDAESTRIVFLGDSRRIQFVGPMPGYLGQGGPQVQVLEFVPGDDGDDLVFSHALLQEFAPEHLLERDPIVLLEGIENGGFEFLARDETGELAGWLASWDEIGQLPVAVNLELAFNEDSLWIWPLMTTGVRVDESATQIGGGRSGSGYQEAIRDLMENRRDDGQ
jgi:general secretion pathway protein J